MAGSIVYYYSGKDDASVDGAKASEHCWCYTPSRYLKRILYGNRNPLLLDPDLPGWRACQLDTADLDTADWIFDGLFDFAEGAYREDPPEDGRIWKDATPAPRQGYAWPPSQDAFSNYRSGFEVHTGRPRRRILMTIQKSWPPTKQDAEQRKLPRRGAAEHAARRPGRLIGSIRSRNRQERRQCRPKSPSC
jgi:Salmonella virulence plasmid 65kDa B protein